MQYDLNRQPGEIEKQTKPIERDVGLLYSSTSTIENASNTSQLHNNIDEVYIQHTVKNGYLAVKRILDLLISGLALIILSPIILIIAILIKAEDGGPVLHHRWCIGKKKNMICSSFEQWLLMQTISKNTLHLNRWKNTKRM